MDLRSDPPLAPESLGSHDNDPSGAGICFGRARMVPATRTIQGERGFGRLEPLMLDVLLLLAEHPGTLVTRGHLRERCWGGQPVGDDSVNRAVAGARRALIAATGSARIVTVPGAGYTLQIMPERPDGAVPPLTGTAVETGWRSWRMGLPAPDLAALDALRGHLSEQADDADAWGMLALIARNAAEYSEPQDCTSLVEECQAAAARAHSLRPKFGVANAALIALPPLFGDWTARRQRLLAALADAPEDRVLRHELAFLEMATGRPSAAVPLIEALITEDPLAAIYQYKRVYHLWTLGRLTAMDQVADRAMQLWPKHPAIWFARYWSLAFTGRADRAREMAEDAGARPPLPENALRLLRLTADAVTDRSEATRRSAIEGNRRSAQMGPAQCLAAIIHLAGLGETDAAFEVAEAYFLNDGPLLIPGHRTPKDSAVTDQYRRMTQMLFIPATADMRRDPRFLTLCAAIGLDDYWREAAVTPDFLRPGTPRIDDD